MKKLDDLLAPSAGQPTLSERQELWISLKEYVPAVGRELPGAFLLVGSIAATVYLFTQGPRWLVVIAALAWGWKMRGCER